MSKPTNPGNRVVTPKLSPRARADIALAHAYEWARVEWPKSWKGRTVIARMGRRLQVVPEIRCGIWGYTWDAADLCVRRFRCGSFGHAVAHVPRVYHDHWTRPEPTNNREVLA